LKIMFIVMKKPKTTFSRFMNRASRSHF